MKITRVRRGEAPDTADRVYIDRLPDGGVSWTGSVDVGGAAVFGATPAQFRTIEEAEADAIAWASAHGATELLIETDHA